MTVKTLRDPCPVGVPFLRKSFAIQRNEHHGFGPPTASNSAQREFPRVDHSMPHLQSFPSVNDMNQTIRGVDHGRIGVLLRWLVLEHVGGFPALAIGFDREVKRYANPFNI